MKQGKFSVIKKFPIFALIALIAIRAGSRRLGYTSVWHEFVQYGRRFYRRHQYDF